MIFFLRSVGSVFRCFHMYFDKVYLVLEEWSCKAIWQGRFWQWHLVNGLLMMVDTHWPFVNPLFGNVCSRLSYNVSELSGIIIADDQLNGMIKVWLIMKAVLGNLFFIVISSVPAPQLLSVKMGTWQVSLTTHFSVRYTLWPSVLVSGLCVPWWGLW